MRRFVPISFALSTIIATGGAAGLAVAGCGDDSNTESALSDSGSDVTVDGSSLVDGATGNVDGNTGVPNGDSGHRPDGGPVGDGACSPSQALVQWPAKQVQALCQHFASCCSGGADGFDMAKCESDNITVGWAYSLPPDPNVMQTCKVTINAGNAASCLNAIAALPCGNVTSTQYAAVTKACNPVLSGTVPIGQNGCSTAFECVPGSYCNTNVDGGQCQALVGEGQPCTQAPVDQACSYLSFGSPALYCDRLSALDAGGGVCQPRKADNTGCVDSQSDFYDEACQSLLCNDNGSCGGSIVMPAPFVCQLYSLDGGPG